MEADLVKREGIPFTAIPAAGVHGVGWRTLPGNVVQLARGFGVARRLIASYRPDALFFTGGFVAVPVALAGRRHPIVLYVPDIEPGLALKSVSRFADRVALTAEPARTFFSPSTPMAVTGYPVRDDLLNWRAEDARRALGLSQDLPVLLVFGGSKGARSINRALLDALPDLLPHMQIVHISGRLDWPAIERASGDLPPEQGVCYHPYPYLHDRMGAALAAADLAVARSGASSLGELPAFELPGILIPYPYAWRYQYRNAMYLVERGGAILLRDEDLPEKLLPAVLDLMTDCKKREAMRIATRNLYSPNAAREIANLVLEASFSIDIPGKA
jgi:UDP-N-acetylglucosamine--N-acetylmuramyl-(pentapeptide) pyrophosphoryl-undecaprenol N-acetylglucosamine transferase